MFSIDDVKSKAFLNYPIIFQDYLCMIYPITIGEIIKSQEKYQYHLNLLTLQNSDLEELIKGTELEENTSLTPFKYLLINCQYNESFLLDLKKAFSTFIQEPVTILCDQGLIVIGDVTEKRFLSENNYEEFQNILRIQNRIKIEEKPPEDETAMAKKFRLRRKELAKAKKKISSNKEETVGFNDLISSLCAYEVGITPFNVGNLSLYAFYELLQRRGEKEKYETDIQSILAGADSKKIKPKYWIRNLNEN